MSTIVIGGNASFSYSADLHKVEPIPGSYCLTISSTFTGAKSPECVEAPARWCRPPATRCRRWVEVARVLNAD